MTVDEHRLANLERIVDIVKAYRGDGKGLQYGVRSTLQEDVNEEAGRTRVDALDVPAERVVELWMARLSAKFRASVEMTRARLSAAAVPARARAAAAAAPARARAAASAASVYSRDVLDLAFAVFRADAYNEGAQERARDRDIEDRIQGRGRYLDADEREHRRAVREVGYCHDQRLCGDGDD
jgi:hypothetical protein